MNTSMIHIVDDDEAVRSALHLLLRSLGMRAQAFESAQEFLDALPGGAPDCLLLDLNMPEMNGAELQETLAARASRIPVIVISARPDSPLAARALAAGARTVLEKPLREQDLIDAVQGALAA
ncbi:MAG: response regulator [Nevskia sp.]|nr:response regulator [Nevskia sp.]